ncbi:MULTISPECIES: hypothetical protein [unclassified Pasteurella]|uniref:hypothetical protein n=1 Tax=unclassified Pasteurella TaxID=2621516 RepID=UPI00107438CD|nr:hypothetical protein [Pasteurella sp. 19428wF3_WM03]TFU51309.1 hypothetical protein E4T92_05745 [Pasteurella sp. WM03]
MNISEIDFPSSEVKEIFVKNASCCHCQSKNIDWKSGEYPNISLYCPDCEQEMDFYEAIVHLLPGEDNFYVECPECEDNNVIEGVCFSCGFELEEGRDYDREKYVRWLMEKNG